MPEFYIHRNGQQQGPYTPEMLNQMRIEPATLVWCEGWPDWKTADSVSELEFIFHTSPYVPNTPPISKAQAQEFPHDVPLWYYVQSNEKKGPVSIADMMGIITKQTLVWKEGMPNWLPAGQVAEVDEVLDMMIRPETTEMEQRRAMAKKQMAAKQKKIKQTGGCLKTAGWVLLAFNVFMTVGMLSENEYEMLVLPGFLTIAALALIFAKPNKNANLNDEIDAATFGHLQNNDF